ncbi:DMSO/TMAO reductase YedYZ heme-binding membrane subunit [Elusimicrobium posterum]|uniref:hypothetical protein n=1 Tax=Elusimicrobium posterum TaxID=3116653 RepID=UPI003C7074F5
MPRIRGIAVENKSLKDDLRLKAKRKYDSQKKLFWVLLFLIIPVVAFVFVEIFFPDSVRFITEIFLKIPDTVFLVLFPLVCCYIVVRAMILEMRKAGGPGAYFTDFLVCFVLLPLISFGLAKIGFKEEAFFENLLSPAGIIIAVILIIILIVFLFTRNKKR